MGPIQSSEQDGSGNRATRVLLSSTNVMDQFSWTDQRVLKQIKEVAGYRDTGKSQMSWINPQDSNEYLGKGISTLTRDSAHQRLELAQTRGWGRR